MVCVRTASVATPARVLRATRERTVLLVRHCPLLRSPTSSCHRLSPWNHTRLSRGAAYPTLTHVLGKTHSSGRAGWCVLPACKTLWNPEVPEAVPVPWASLLWACCKRAETKPPPGYTPKPALPLPPVLPGCLSCRGPRPEGARLRCQGGFPGTLVPWRPHSPTRQSLRLEGLQKTNCFQCKWKA